jgi:hypothetical protein
MMKYLIGLLFFLAPALAFAELVSPDGSNAWEFYAFGNGEVLWEMLNSVQSMVNSEGYRNLATLLAVAGIAVVAVAAGFDPGKAAQKFMGYVVLAFIAMYLLFKMTANVIVIDPITGYSNVATGIPAVVAVPAAAISEMGYWLTEKIEQNFSLPDSLTVSKGGGFMLGASLMNDAMKVKINDPYLRQSMAVYVSDCVIPDIANGTILTSDVLKATNLWNVLKVQNNSLLTVFYSASSPAGVLVGCASVWSLIDSTINSVSNDMLTEGMGAWSGTPAGMASNLASASTFLSGNSIPLSGTAIIKQTAVANMFNESFKTAAARTGNSEMMIAMQIAQAEQSQKSSWFMASELFKNMMGYIYSVLQAFIFALTPIIMILLFIPGFGKSVLKNYGQIMVWLVLWAPMMAIISYIVSAYGKQGMSAMAAQTQGYTLQTIPVVSDMTNNMILAGGFLMTMVPMISWGLVKGAMAFTEFISAGIGSSFASGAASGAATDSLSLNNQSMGNLSANKQDIATKSSLGWGGVDAKLGAGAASSTRERLNAGPGARTEHGVLKAKDSKQEAGATISEAAAEQQVLSATDQKVISAGHADQVAVTDSSLNAVTTARTGADGKSLTKTQTDAAAFQTADALIDATQAARAGSSVQSAELSGKFSADVLKGLHNKLAKNPAQAAAMKAETLKQANPTTGRGRAAGWLAGAMGWLSPTAAATYGVSQKDMVTETGTKSKTNSNTQTRTDTTTLANAQAYSKIVTDLNTKLNTISRTQTGTESDSVGRNASTSQAFAESASRIKQATITASQTTSLSVSRLAGDADLDAARAEPPQRLPTNTEATVQQVLAKNGEQLDKNGNALRQSVDSDLASADAKVSSDKAALAEKFSDKDGAVTASLNGLSKAIDIGGDKIGAQAKIKALNAKFEKEGTKVDAATQQLLENAVSKTKAGQELIQAGLSVAAAAGLLGEIMMRDKAPKTPPGGATDAPDKANQAKANQTAPDGKAPPAGDGDTVSKKNPQTGKWETVKNVGKGVGKAIAPVAAVLTAVDVVNEARQPDSTAAYAKRLGISEPTGDGSPEDVAKFVLLRTLGAATDVGNALTFGQAKKHLYADGQAPAAPAGAGAPAAAPAGAGAPAAAPAGAGAPAAAPAGAGAPAAAPAGAEPWQSSTSGAATLLPSASAPPSGGNIDIAGFRAEQRGAMDSAFPQPNPTNNAQPQPASVNAAASDAQLQQIQATAGMSPGLSVMSIENGEAVVVSTTGEAMSDYDRNQLESSAAAAGLQISSIREVGVTPPTAPAEDAQGAPTAAGAPAEVATSSEASAESQVTSKLDLFNQPASAEGNGSQGSGNRLPPPKQTDTEAPDAYYSAAPKSRGA